MKLVKDMYFPDSDEWMANEYATGKTTYETVNKALSFLTKTRTCVTAGAHVGVYVRKFAEIFDRVIAFEPSEKTFECLHENTKHLFNVFALNAGLSNRTGAAGLSQDTSHEGNTGGVFVTADGEDCILQVLDSHQMEDVDLIFLDAEGHELKILQGAIETIKKCKPVIVAEEKARLMERQGVKPNDVVEFLGKLGYKRADRRCKDFVYIPA